MLQNETSVLRAGRDAFHAGPEYRPQKRNFRWFEYVSLTGLRVAQPLVCWPPWIMVTLQGQYWEMCLRMLPAVWWTLLTCLAAFWVTRLWQWMWLFCPVLVKWERMTGTLPPYPTAEATRWAGERQKLWAKGQGSNWLWRECGREGRGMGGIEQKKLAQKGL